MPAAFSNSPKLGSVVIACLISMATATRADEGMWLFNNPPLKQFKEKYQFEPTPQWLEHLQKSSVRFNSGGSGSFVSANGLVITNHHVGLDTLQKISSEKNNYVRDGFYAKIAEGRSQGDRSRAQCADVDRRCDRRGERGGAIRACRGEEAGKARSNVIAQIEKESQGENRIALRCGHALPGRRLPSLSLQTLRRRAPRLRAGGTDRVLRRRSG